jgi:chromosome segregation ATPase
MSSDRRRPPPSPRSFYDTLERSRKRLLSTLVLRARDELSLFDAPDDSPPDPFWIQLETILSRQESRMAILRRKASKVRAALEQSQRQTSVAHATRMREASAELARVRAEVANAEAAIDDPRADVRADDVRAQIAHADTKIREATWLVARLRKATAQLGGRLEALVGRESSDALRRARVERGMRDADEGLREAERQIAELDAEARELEKREAACSLLVASLAPPEAVAAKILSKRTQK